MKTRIDFLFAEPMFGLLRCHLFLTHLHVEALFIGININDYRLRLLFRRGLICILLFLRPPAANTSTSASWSTSFPSTNFCASFFMCTLMSVLSSLPLGNFFGGLWFHEKNKGNYATSSHRLQVASAHAATEATRLASQFPYPSAQPLISIKCTLLVPNPLSH